MSPDTSDTQIPSFCSVVNSVLCQRCPKSRYFVCCDQLIQKDILYPITLGDEPDRCRYFTPVSLGLLGVPWHVGYPNPKFLFCSELGFMSKMSQIKIFWVLWPVDPKVILYPITLGYEPDRCRHFTPVSVALRGVPCHVGYPNPKFLFCSGLGFMSKMSQIKVFWVLRPVDPKRYLVPYHFRGRTRSLPSLYTSVGSSSRCSPVYRIPKSQVSVL